jgi:hypothetical protein
LILCCACLPDKQACGGQVWQFPNTGSLSNNLLIYVQGTNAGSGNFDANISIGQIVSNQQVYATIPYLPTNTLDWWIGDSISASNGQSVTDWTGIMGHDLHGHGEAYLDAQTCAGHASVYFPNAGTMTNATVTVPTLTNQFTLFIVYKFKKSSVVLNAQQEFPIAFGYTYPPSFCYKSLIYVVPPEALWSSTSSSGGFWAQNNGYNAYDFFPATYDRIYIQSFAYCSNYFRQWHDGVLQIDSNVGPLAASVGGEGLSGWMAVGGVLISGSAIAMLGNVAEVGLCSNVLDNAHVDRVNAALMSKYNLTTPAQLILDGDSMQVSGFTTGTSNNAPIDLISGALPGVQCVLTAYGGRSSAQNLQNSTNWLGTSVASQNRVVWFWSDLVNGSETWQTLATNVILMAGNAHAHGMKFIMTIPPSSITADTTDNSRSNFWIWTTNLYQWTNIADGLVDFSRDPNAGPYLAYATNTTFYGPAAWGGIHWTNAGYNECYPGFAIPVIKSVLYGTYACTQTNTPPPTANQPWYCQDPRSGHLFVNQNGSWVSQ